MAFDLNSDSFNYVAKMMFRVREPGEERIGIATMGMRWMRSEEEREQRKQERVWLHVE